MEKYFYRVVDDLSILDRWFLGTPHNKKGRELDPRDFTEGKVFSTNYELIIPPKRQGKELDFTFADFDMPVVSGRTGKIISSFASEGIQRIPARIQGYKSQYEVLNVTALKRCVDEKKSEILYWKKDDGRPDKVGDFRMISKLKVNPKLIGDMNICRIAGWEIALIVSRPLKMALEQEEVSGIKFLEVS